MRKFIINTTTQMQDCEAALKLNSRRIYKAFNMKLISTRTRQTLAKPFCYKLTGIQENTVTMERNPIVVAQRLESFLNKRPSSKLAVELNHRDIKNMRDNGMLFFALPLKSIKKTILKPCTNVHCFFWQSLMLPLRHTTA